VGAKVLRFIEQLCVWKPPKHNFRKEFDANGFGMLSLTLFSPMFQRVRFAAEDQAVLISNDA